MNSEAFIIALVAAMLRKYGEQEFTREEISDGQVGDEMIIYIHPETGSVMAIMGRKENEITA